LPEVVRAASGDSVGDGGDGDESGESGGSVFASRHFWVLVGAAVIAPLCFLPSLDRLKFTSALSLCFVLFLTSVVVLSAGVDDSIGGTNDASSSSEAAHSHSSSSSSSISSESGEPETVAVAFDGSTLSHLTVFIFGFTCHQNIFPITNELKGAASTPHALPTVVVASVAAAFSIYFAVAVAGYSTFGDAVSSDVLTSCMFYFILLYLPHLSAPPFESNQVKSVGR
jgi:amino acid permease